METLHKKNRIVWVDALNIVACAGVLLLHCTNGQVHGFSGSPSVDWYIGLFTHSVFLWPVNVFFMLSGYTLIRKSLIDNVNRGVKSFYKRRASRLGIALIAWNILYMLLNVAKLHYKGEPQDGIIEIAFKFFFFKYNGFMWFFVPLILIYLSMPFFAQFVINSKRQLLKLYLIMAMALSFIPPLNTNGASQLSVLNSIQLMASPYLFFIVAGYYFGNYDISLKMRKWIYLLALLSIVVIYAGTMFLTLNVPTHYRYFLSYTNIPCTLTAIAVFLLFKYADWNKILFSLHLTPEQLAKYSGLSFGIYLIQMAWFTIIGHLHVCENHILLKFFIMYLLCAVSVAVMKRVPLVKRLVP